MPRAALPRLVLPALIAGLLFGLAVALTPTTPESYRNRTPVRAMAPLYPPQAPKLADETLRAGLLTSHTQRGDRLLGLDEAVGPGACAFDYDGDGWIDLLTIGGSGQTRYYGDTEWWHESPGLALFRNRRDGRFENVTADSGLDAVDWGMGCAHADLDNDGDQDLILTNLGANRLYRNDGGGHFSDLTEGSGMAGSDWSTGAALADFNGDGLVDLYVVNYLRFRKGERTYERASGFKTDLATSFDPQLYDSAPNRLYRNLGNLHFEDVTEHAGVANPSGRGLDAIWLDANDDSRPDLFVANDIGLPSALFINLDASRFENQADGYRLKSSTGAHGIALGDLNADLSLDLVLTTPLGRPLRAYLGEATEDAFRFRDAARNLGLTSAAMADHAGWGAVLGDLNLDGRQDLFVAQGLVVPDAEAPRMPQGQPNALWLGTADGRFVKVRPSPDSAATRGAVTADFDNDGDLDLYLANNNGTGQLLRNRIRDADSQAPHWIGFSLRSTVSNRDAIGARVTLHQAAGKQSAVVTAGAGFLSDGDRRVLFGLGDDPGPLSVTVTWPDGTESRFDEIGSGRYWTLEQGSTQPLLMAAARAVERTPRLRLTLHADEPEFRAAYIRMIARHSGTDAVADEIEAALADSEAQVRLAAVEALAATQSNTGLRLLPDALADQDPKVRAAAAHGLQSYESEYTVRWLLAALDDQDAAVQCATADLFQTWFKEEEAVVVQKYRSVPRLIRLLESPDTHVRRCAARALGEAEQFRAVSPLLDRLSDDDAQVRGEAVRALGMIRDRLAVQPLIDVAQDVDESAEVRGKALIGLRRLSFAGFDDLIRTLLSRTGDAGAPESIDSVLSTLMAAVKDREDGIVIPKPVIRSLVLAHFNSSAAMPVDASNLLELLEGRPIQQSVDLLRRLSSSMDWRLSGRALAILLAQGRAINEEGNARFRTATVQVQNETMRWLDRYRASLPTALLIDRLSEPATFVAAAALAGKRQRPDLEGLVRYRLASDGRNPEVAAAAIRALTRMGATQHPLPDECTANVELLPATLVFWSAHNKGKRVAKTPDVIALAMDDDREDVLLELVQVIAPRTEPWARQALESVLMRSDAPLMVRRLALEQIASASNRYATRTLQQISRLRNDPLGLEVLPILLQRLPERSWQAAVSILQDQRVPMDLRLLYLHALYDADPQRTLSLLTRTGL